MKVLAGSPVKHLLVSSVQGLEKKLPAPQGAPAFKLLDELFKVEKDPDVKETILRHIAERGDDPSRKTLIELAKSGADSDLREAAIRHLAERGGRQVHPRRALLHDRPHAESPLRVVLVDPSRTMRLFVTTMS